ncbi:hypothetical protein [Hoeflea prorocentri]|uniref:Uncharacterized protein n=1 Tax=Hoeflea prorocentri TaxID=1922333 RepID=A0A9X3UES2_9HYPH|nr:hypothetical protein [Hoeflea prorocentri]MCY6379386.1 hypothetical protein [Hoeflea prorocentri]MDA5397187.1 hypothetical protein [Hoeflea prorocentri]
MVEDEDRPIGSSRSSAANDNGDAATRCNATVLTLARLIGRQIAREAFEQPSPDNDNRPAPRADEE